MTDGATRDEPTRRSVLRGAALAGVGLPLLAACGGGGGSAGSGASGGSGSGGSGSGDASIAKADVPVGGGKILAQDEVVVVQPIKGEFKAYSAICTHQGCTVGKIEDGQIICPCHLSHFSIKDGHNTQGPNGTPAGSVQPLAPKKVTVKGDQLSIT